MSQLRGRWTDGKAEKPAMPGRGFGRVKNIILC
jgi:hypothetical protein